MSRALWGGYVLREIGVQPHLAIFGFENVRELVEQLVVRNLAIYCVVLLLSEVTKDAAVCLRYPCWKWAY